ncbi:MULTISPECIES: hypothetical protein [Nostoc]|uniref:Uncharacterized protein n=2 Tax=Nostoc TaxID=1177 RepID=A0ABR8IFB2_9NOSO|nr:MULTISPECIES: hypothetical protein [Nostoc]MBD2563024.1 hypothetical protein [Nostoc linckia FACHB-391]MBD2649170.1 hypothetical protein [Nostoc foliaceum FACHB-393]
MTLSKNLKQFVKSNTPLAKWKGSIYTKAIILKNHVKNYDIYQQILSPQQSNELVTNLIKDSKPFMISRFGSTEAYCVHEYLKGGYKGSIFESISNDSGFFPADKKHLDRFSQLFLESSKSIDVLGVWFQTGEPEIIRNSCPKASFVELNTLEPYYHNDPWSKNLEGKKVLVIHPFAETISSQYKNHRKLLFENQNILPEFELITFKAVQSLAGTQTQFNTWFDAYDWMCNKIKDQDFDIAIIGCGAYGLPLAAYIKSLGKQALHLGGATQILFGIKGNRWDKIPFFQSLYNESWVRCRPDDVPTSPSKYPAYW